MGSVVANYVELDLPYCAETFGESPCTATGVPCFNTRNLSHDCGDPDNYNPTTITVRFAEPNGYEYWPNDPIFTLPILGRVSSSSAKIMPAENMGTRATCNISLKNGLSTMAGLDKNIIARDNDFQRGTFLGKFKARFPYIFGSAVHTANRMTSQTKAGQIIISETIYMRLSPEWQGVTRQVDVSVPRGQHDEIGVYEVLWQGEDVTSMLPAIASITERHRPYRIRLRYRDTEITLDDRQRANLTMGRGDDNDLVVYGNLVSRLHARIEAGPDTDTVAKAMNVAPQTAAGKPGAVLPSGSCAVAARPGSKARRRKNCFMRISLISKFTQTTNYTFYKPTRVSYIYCPATTVIIN